MEQHEWEQAYSSFQEAFRFFEEAGNSLKIPCLKYLVLANMLRLSKVDTELHNLMIFFFFFSVVNFPVSDRSIQLTRYCEFEKS
jgi:hypothetical protein